MRVLKMLSAVFFDASQVFQKVQPQPLTRWFSYGSNAAGSTLRAVSQASYQTQKLFT